MPYIIRSRRYEQTPSLGSQTVGYTYLRVREVTEDYPIRGLGADEDIIVEGPAFE